MRSMLTDGLRRQLAVSVSVVAGASSERHVRQWLKPRWCRPPAPPQHRCRGITLIDVSVLLTFAAIAVSVATMERVRGQARDFAISSGLELREVLDAAMVYRYQTGEWPLNDCSRRYATGLGDDCNGDGSADSGDLSGLTQLVEVGRLPDLQRYPGQQRARRPMDRATAMGCRYRFGVDCRGLALCATAVR